MDTKWKKNKGVIGFISWFLGISILIFNGWMLIMEISCYKGDFGRQVETIFQEDYQNVWEFRESISDSLDIFVEMSIAGSSLADERPGERTEFGWDYEYEDMPEIAAEVTEGAWYGYGDGYACQDYGLRMSREEAEEYHNLIKDERNILYRIERSGEILFTNEETLGQKEDSTPVLPEGYNFFLYFNGEKVEIWKDGKKIDVYGDGYYREDSDWYVPGYFNFPAG